MEVWGSQWTEERALMLDLYGRCRGIHCEIGDSCLRHRISTGAECARCEDVISILKVCIAGTGIAG